MKMTTELFIEKSNETHNFKYNYDKTIYTGFSNKVIITCSEHSDFSIRPHNHSGKQANGCPACSNLKKLDNNSFIEKANAVHNFKYDYSVSNYRGHRYKLNIICEAHGIFSMTANDHLNGYGCGPCSYEYRGNNRKLSNDEFIKKAIKIHGLKYNYDLADYHNTHVKVKILCNKHGLFEQTPLSHLSGSGCPNCSNSKGENIIFNWLKNHNIDFEVQKKFSNCCNKQPLPFDFYLPIYDLLIEYNGIQHYKDVFKFKSNKENKNKSFQNRQFLDNIKRNYAIKNHNYLEISYLDNIEEKLKTKLNENKD